MGTNFTWPEGRKCAVSLTYDDALPIHYQYVAPALEARGLRGTFFLLISGDPINNPERWGDLAARGHELGNHSLFHPCRRQPPENYQWLDPSFDTRTYTPTRLQLELRLANFVLYLLDGKRQRTFGSPCSETYIGPDELRIPISDVARKDFVAARGAMTDQMVEINTELDLMNVGHCTAEARSFDDLRAEINAAKNVSAWLVYMIHGVGRETNELYIERDVHETLLDFLAADKEIWVKPFINVALWVSRWQQMA
jgi:peptidoglycan-N-acetylglucosamine deacetylase